MKFPERYRKQGNFRLHSGQNSDIFYDVNEMLTDDSYLRQILDKVPMSDHYVGIATGGAIIARLISSEIKSKFSMIKDGELKGDFPSGEWILIDDVTTTGASLEEAVKIVGKNPEEIFVVVDRRTKNERPKVFSVFEP